jgi:PKD repeat protein
VNRATKRLLLPLVAVALALAVPGIATAAPPANDAVAAAVVVEPSALPYSDSVSIDDATLEGGEPGSCAMPGKTVWYRLTPSSSGVLKVDVGSSFFDRVLTVYRQGGSGIGGLTTIACVPYYTGQSSATFTATTGTAYYVQAGSAGPSTSGTLSLTIQSVPPPPNDGFANAVTIAEVPYNATVDLSGATLESGELVPSCSGQGGSAWYAFTAPVTRSYTLRSHSFGTPLAAYTGSSFASLSQIGCQSSGSVTFHADAGATVYLRVAANQFPGMPTGLTQLGLDVAPEPVAGFSYNPFAPSAFDTVQFFDTTYDPAGVGVESWSWDYGDGGSATSPGCCTSHRYAADGTYRATLTVVTHDGRTATAARDVEVETHDVAIAQVAVPDAIAVGRTKAVSVGISNTRYAETVQVQVMKSVPGGGWQQVGVLTQYVPVRKARRTTEFSFNYTATPEDAAVGKVTFQAVAVIQGAPDAIPADNTYISLPVKVRS